MTEEQIKEVMRLADEIADYAWKEGLSDGAYSNAKQDRECRAESRAELEAYLRTIGEPESVNAELLDARRLREAESEAVKSERRAIAFGDIVHQFTIAMRAAVVAAHLEGPDHGMQWIYNTLAGPGHLPDLDDARALGGAQAMFDAEMAEHEAFRAAHPAPAIQSPKSED